MRTKVFPWKPIKFAPQPPSQVIPIDRAQNSTSNDVSWRVSTGSSANVSKNYWKTARKTEVFCMKPLIFGR